MITYRQTDRSGLLRHPDAISAVRRDGRFSVVAIRQTQPFEVAHDGYTLNGESGDYLMVCREQDANDPWHNVWLLSAERYGRNYEPVRG